MAGDESGGAGPIRRRLGSSSVGKGKEQVQHVPDKPSSSKSAQSRTTAINKEATPATDPSLFQAKDEDAHKKLLKKNAVWKLVEQGQEAFPAGRGEYWLRCRLCSKVFRGSSTKVVDHFLKVQKPCPFRTGEIVDELVTQGGKVNPKDKNTRYLLQNFRGLSRGVEGGEEAAENASDAKDPSSWPVPPPVRGRSVPQGAAPIATTDDEAAARGDGGTGGGEACAKVVVVKTQTTIRKWIDNDAQKKLDVALLLKDLSSLPWVKDTVKMANTIVKFIRNHHATHGLMMCIDDSLSLLRPTEVRFGSVYQMLHRLEDRAEVLNEMVEGGSATKWRPLRWSGEKLQKKADLVYYTARSEDWWAKVKKIVAIMEPVYSLLKRMDREGVSPTNLVEFDDLIARKLANVVLTKKEREDVMDQPHMDMWDHLYEFLRELVEEEVRTDEHMWTPGAIMQATRRTPVDWWILHSGDVPALQEIAINVLGMWSTTTPAERNKASMDFVHSKRRNSLSPESLEKLVYIHWNMQLLGVPNSKDNGYIDVWGSFFEPLMEPATEDGAIEEPTEDETADNIEEEKSQKRLKKTPKNRIPKSLLDDDSSGSSDLEDLVWKGKCWNESTSEEGDNEDDIGEDSDFELGSKPAVPATTYVGQRLGRREKEAEVLPSEPIDRLHTDIEFLAHPMPDADEEEASRAKAMADRDAALVRRRMCEEEFRRAAVPTRRERERQSKQVPQHEEQHSEEKDERVDNMEVDDAAVRAENEGRLQHAGVDIEAVGEKNVQQEEEKSSPREGDDMKEDVDKTQQQGEEEMQGPTPPTVYTRRPRPLAPHQPAPQEPQEDQQAVVAEQPETLGSTVRGFRGAAVHSGSPPYPAQNEDAQHDNVWKSRAGRKRKAPVNDLPAPDKPRRHRGRPRKEKMGHETAPKSERGRGRPRKVRVSKDDPDSDACSSESPDNESSKGDSE
ncbi:hypothetical protein CBR_g48184 [Chara braunii]|uniref:HAT C-terminal dimerisation domain-containing protein n=1 Tax=Chara braunii TaxID=69332 RepID=A0A388M2G3_CHABU|nr:hypothetical protein CBR_g48184 [Chara braunii]|eukprot:GBG88653.1 hypothetical protein CBR_g48184 [Chara braunii]